MYSFVDRPVDSLSQGSRFVLWAMRRWTSAREAHTCPPHALSPSFQGMGALDALSPFHLGMVVLNCHSRLAVEVAQIDQRRIGADEAVLLALWRDSLDASARPRRDATLVQLLDTRADTAARLFDAAASALAEAGLAPDGLDRNPAGEIL
ncbi:hypothetical protein [Sphingomonas immobilis]|uniref:Uncharacterized protein n=1 Tax=Sphingomonas immobilis TaxID=3063997 RepID=A0ABT8ZT05_9SPHN|nr:hypothetical protein [Sphingomonas sp. CA1-15]MDO7840705.1 hypothetical protein [Sphingomonas sp. CA1-15]